MLNTRSVSSFFTEKEISIPGNPQDSLLTDGIHASILAVTAVKTVVPNLKDYLMPSQVPGQMLLTRCQDSAVRPGMLLLTTEE